MQTRRSPVCPYCLVALIGTTFLLVLPELADVSTVRPGNRLEKRDLGDGREEPAAPGRAHRLGNRLGFGLLSVERHRRIEERDAVHQRVPAFIGGLRREWMNEQPGGRKKSEHDETRSAHPVSRREIGASSKWGQIYSLGE